MEKTRFKSYLSESTNDKGIFKCIFMAGIPGSGKTYTLEKITDGQIEPRIVNTDKMVDFLANMSGTKITPSMNPTIKRMIVDKSKHLTATQLTQYLNGMLPLVNDGTSNSINNVLRRRGQLESIGYDCGMVWINTSLDVAIERAKQRERHVDIDFIKHVHYISQENKDFYYNKFDFFLEIDNDEDVMDDKVIMQSYRHARRFFTQPIHNPIGKRNLQKLKEAGASYLSPALYTQDELDEIANNWYISK